jgi:2-polyprenyl-3-methyl-5-hydroxy-6-metoxy-1,4-benzoquinol methylase
MTAPIEGARDLPSSPTSRYHREVDTESDSTHAKVVRLVGSEKRILELGCATGHMSRALRDRGCRIVGIDIDATMATNAAASCERVIVGDIELLDWAAELGDDRFDVIIAADVLEHLKDPLATLLQVKTYLQPDGYMVVSMPNVAHGSVRLALLSGRFPYAEVGLLDRGHLRFYTRDTMEELFEDAGLAIRHLERQEMMIEASEVAYDPAAVPPELVAALATDPEALTYQFIVMAYPMSPIELALVQRRIREVAQRDATIRDLQATLHQQIDWARQSAKEVAARDAIIRDLHATLGEQTTWAQTSAAEVVTRDAIVRDLQATLDEQAAWARQSAAEVAARDTIIGELRTALDEQTAWAKNSAAEVAIRDAIIRDLQSKDAPITDE